MSANGIRRLSEELMHHIYKHGYFMMSDKSKKKYWIDLYSMSHVFNASKNAVENRALLKDILSSIVLHQMNECMINSIIIPRWTCSTEDLFSETLLNICFEIANETPNLAVYELFSAGGESSDKNNYYLNFVDILAEDNIPSGEINAIVFIALDIHSWIIDFLLENPAYTDKDCNNLKIQSVFSVVGRCGQYPKTKKRRKPEEFSNFNIFPIFNASDVEKENLSEFPFIMDENTDLYKNLYRGDYNCRQYIPFSEWKTKYSN